ncbi:hypothetical protein ALC62_06471 [Cyphomyrmex costatus]|uniref:Gustatory receptor n=1 Tax=Cyphomyrmex costatus TaxID=456900 RepID=A0A195CQB9_9HYME|nr:hypothetical protein ALC62_06471 [Cyphomyrmex costatus]
MTKPVCIHTALAPLLIISSFYSLVLFEYPFGQSRLYLSYLHFLTTWSLSIYFLYYLCNNGHPVISLYITWRNILIMIITITSILISLFRLKELKLCLRKLSIVDDTLEALGMPKEYQRLHNWIIRIIIAWIIFIFSDNAICSFFLSYYYYYGLFDIVCIYIPFAINYLQHVNILSALTSGAIIGYTSSRFHRVNDCLLILYSELLENNTDYRRQNRCILVCQRITGVKDRKQYIWIIM